MLSGETLAVVAWNRRSELARLEGRPRTYFAERHLAAGIVEGLERYGSFELDRDRISERA